jgi:hypothetical protein
MADIFDNTILCKNCRKEMLPDRISKRGFILRTLKCPNCKNQIIHPEDKKDYEEFIRLKEKEYNVKMRMVGNSYAVSIPREIVDFMQEQERMINNMVKLSFEEAGKISLGFETRNPRVISSEEVKIVKNGKPIYHARKVSDSSDPSKNKTKIYKANKEED